MRIYFAENGYSDELWREKTRGEMALEKETEWWDVKTVGTLLVAFEGPFV